MYFFEDLIYILLEIYIFIISIFFLMFLTFLKKNRNLIFLKSANNLFIYFILLSFFILYNNITYYFYAFNNEIICDLSIIFIKNLYLLILLMILFISSLYLIFKKLYYGEFFFFIGLLIISSFILISSNDFILFYLMLELQSLIIYTLLTLNKYNQTSNEASLKYFILSVLVSGLFLFGISIFYGYFGFINFSDIKLLTLQWSILSNFPIFILFIIFFFILSIFLFKLGLIPFQNWILDVYSNSPTLIAFFLSTLSKLIFFFFFIKIYFYIFYDFNFIWYYILNISGIFSIFIGSLAALNQVYIKRLYGYSSIVNFGYLILIISIGTLDVLEVAFNHLFIYLISTILVFYILIIFRKNFGKFELKTFLDLKIMLNYNIMLAIIIAIVFFSLIGLPPLAGFFTKFFLFFKYYNYYNLTFFFFFILVISLIAAIYYIKCVQFIFFDNKFQSFFFFKINFFFSVLLMIFFFILLFFFFYQDQFFLFIKIIFKDLFF